MPYVNAYHAQLAILGESHLDCTWEELDAVIAGIQVAEAALGADVTIEVETRPNGRPTVNAYADASYNI